MNKEILEAVTGEVRELLEAGSCCKEAKDAAQAWLDAVGTDKESEQAKKLVAELEEDRLRLRAPTWARRCLARKKRKSCSSMRKASRRRAQNIATVRRAPLAKRFWRIRMS